MALGTIPEEVLATSNNCVVRSSLASSCNANNDSNNTVPSFSPSGERSSSTSAMQLSEKVSKFVIQARCTDNLLFSAAASTGCIALFLQTLPIIMNNWVLLTEPRPINKTNENGELMETTFNYNTGYFQICRVHIVNCTGVIYDELEMPKSDATYICHFNPLFSGADLSEFSLASLAVILRLGLPGLLHASGACVCSLAYLLGVIGHIRKSFASLISSISYILGSIVLCTAVLMVVCVVDDELAPRMKPTASGEPSKFSYTYGSIWFKALNKWSPLASAQTWYPFFSAALSFLPVQICACVHAFLYFRRFPTVAEKLKYVPGLEAKLRHAQLDKELGIPPIETWRRGSLASYLPFTSCSVTSRRNSRRSSQASYSNPNLLYIQEV